MNILKQIQQYKPYNKQEVEDKKIFLKYLEDFDNSFQRDNKLGHFCASAFVLNKKRTKVLMIYHKVYNSWGWLGGHADGDKNLEKVALKEVKEESGLENVYQISKDIFSIDTLPVLGHEKKGNYLPAHTHLSVTYLFEAKEKDSLRLNKKETEGVKWVDIDKMVFLCKEPQMKYVYDKVIRKLREEDII